MIRWTRHPDTGSYWSDGGRFLIEWDNDSARRQQRVDAERWVLYDYELPGPNARQVGRGRVSTLKRSAESILRREQANAEARRRAEEERYEARRTQDSGVAGTVREG